MLITRYFPEFQGEDIFWIFGEFSKFLKVTKFVENLRKFPTLKLCKVIQQYLNELVFNFDVYRRGSL